jgi:hypothetical protein
VLPIRIVWEFVEPTATLPKFTLDGVRLIALIPACRPVPLSATVDGDPGALLEIVMVAGRLPAVVGENTALNVALAPAAIVRGVANPLTL